MIFTDDFITTILVDKKNLCMNKKIALLMNFNRILSVYSDSNDTSESTDTLSTLKDMVDLLNQNINMYEQLLLGIKEGAVVSSSYEEQFQAILDNDNQISSIVNKLVSNIEFHDNKLELDSTASCNSTSEEINNACVSDTTDVTNDEKQANNVDFSPINISDDTFEDNNTLLISEKEGKVFLPYKKADVLYLLQKNPNYSDEQDVINDKYILPLDRFKNSVLSRFKESYYLVKNKEKQNTLQAIELGLDLAFNSELNPAIISACRNLDELDIYLDYLAENELDKFDLFDIKYEILPR